MSEDSQVSTPAAWDGNQTRPVDGQRLKQLVEAGLTWLRTNQQIVNALNVFPVPDGDTGTNMVLTMQAAFDEIAALKDLSVSKMAHAVARGALMGARGNSGVILSQIWRGFARALDTVEIIDTHTLVKALVEARETAYKGVVRPVEGTILTVIKDVSIAAEQALSDTQDLPMLMEKIVEAADLSVQHTPELLPILKQAGVVDSGGKGLFYIFEGILRYIKGLPLNIALHTVQPLSSLVASKDMETIEPGQDFEVVIDFMPSHPLELDRFYKDLSELGTSIQIGEGEGIYRLHIHVSAEKRYAPIDYTMSLGTISKVYIENLVAQIEQQEKEQSHKLNLPTVKPGQIAVVAVSPGAGISRIFASLGAAAIVEGGQTMNPSTEEILQSFENFPTDYIVILPNNKNIILAAQTAASLTVKKIAVIPCRSVPQGLSSMLRFLPDGDFDQVVQEMNSALNDVETGEITIATRSVEINGVSVHEGEVIALHNGQIIRSANSLEEACMGLLEKANTSSRERITLLSGQNVSRNEVNQIVDAIRLAYPAQEVELHSGEQPYYQFIISIE